MAYIIELPKEGLSVVAVLQQVERELIEQALKRVNGNQRLAANLLGLQRTCLNMKLAKMGKTDKNRHKKKEHT